MQISELGLVLNERYELFKNFMSCKILEVFSLKIIACTNSISPTVHITFVRIKSVLYMGDDTKICLELCTARGISIPREIMSRAVRNPKQFFVSTPFIRVFL